MDLALFLAGMVAGIVCCVALAAWCVRRPESAVAQATQRVLQALTGPGGPGGRTR